MSSMSHNLMNRSACLPFDGKKLKQGLGKDTGDVDLLGYEKKETPIFGVETVQHPFHPESYGSGMQEESSVLSLLANTGKYYVTTVRLYFPCEFSEPPPELLPEVAEEGSWWACSIS